MPKWVERAKKVSQRSQQNLAAASLQEVVDEARSVANDIQFIIESSGQGVVQSIGYDNESIEAVEKFYRLAAKQPSSIPFGIEDFERLLSLYLGQVLVERALGEWTTYQGKYHVYFPIVIRLSDGNHVDVFLFCQGLYRKQVRGSLDGRALIKFLEAPGKLATP
ncbi:hypothetical protein [Bremerella sp.]|uniref:hypothetical protein n=1 Tax=Bremerella sp. TaxID=2795602 RepID=UPI00391AAB5C